MNNLEDKNILITGGAGSVGKRLASRFAAKEPNVIRLLDNSESDIARVKKHLKGNNFRFFLGDIRDKERLEKAMENVDIVVHTAAIKHVDISEYNPFEAVKTNIMGVQNVVDVAIENNISNIVFTSSDKAASPSNTMGATKLLGEKLFAAGNTHSGMRETTFSSVRFGNVINSSQSVVPVFKDQIRKEGKIKLTSRKMTRFFLTFNQVFELIEKALDVSNGGEVFIHKMEAMRIEDLAETVIDLYAEELGRDPAKVEIDIIGKRPGETYHEHIMTHREADRAFENEDIYAIPPDGTTEHFLDSRKMEGFEKSENVVISSENAKKLGQKEIKTLLENAF